MAHNIRKIDYFYGTVDDQPGEAYRVLSQLAELGVPMLAFTAVPVGPTRTQLTFFPDDSQDLIHAAKQAGMTLDGPHHALMVQGDDELGVLADIHKTLYQADVNVYASNGITDGKGGYGYVMYVRPEKFEQAAIALGLQGNA